MRASPNIVLAILVLGAVVLSNALLFDGAPGHWLSGVSGRWFSPVSQRLAWLGAYGGALTGRFDIASDRLQLEQQQQEVRAQMAQMDQLKNDLAFYRSVAALRATTEIEMLRAGVFSWPTQGGVRQLVVNRGSDDSVAEGDVIATADGALVGVIADVYSDHAVAVALGDVGLEITARIVGTDISGLVSADADGLSLNLVQQGEKVIEGQIVVTGGNDRLPAGLVIGTVRSVDHETAALFVPVRIDQAVTQPYAGAVLIIGPQ